MRALVIDTNVLVSAALAPSGVPARAVDRALDRFALALTRKTFREFRRVLGSSKFTYAISRRDRNQYLDRVRRNAVFFELETGPPISRDPDDDVYLHLALAASAAALVTSNRDLLVLVEFAGIPILSPSRFLRAERSIRRGRQARGG